MNKLTEAKYQIVTTLEYNNFNLGKDRKVETKIVAKSLLKKITPILKTYEQLETKVDFYPLSKLGLTHVHNKLVGINVFIKTLENDKVFEIDDEILANELNLKRKRIKTISLTLSDGFSEMPCLNFCTEDSVQNAKQLVGKRVRLVGIPILIPTERRISNVFFMVLDMQPQLSHLELLSSSEEEKTWVKKWVDLRTKERASLIDLLSSRSIKALNIQLSNDHIIHKVIRFAVLMVLSGGKSDHTVFSLNCLLIGRSGAGKKIITNIIRFLSPVFKEAQANSVNRVGLVGPTTSKDGAWTHTPGLLPQAHGGCLSIQDAHHIDDMKGASGVFSMVMEDGILMRSNAAMSEVEAVVSLLLDINRKHQITGIEPDNEVDDLWGLPIHVLTRFDAIIDLPVDVDRQLEIAVEMLKNFKTRDLSKNSNEERRVKLIVAYIKDTFNTVTLSQEIKDYAAEKWKAYFEENKSTFNRLPNLGDFQLRMTNSLIKLIITIARAHFRNTTTIADVDEATDFLEYKISYLLKAAPSLTANALITNIKDKPRWRQKTLKSKFEDKIITVKALKRFYREEFGFEEEGLERKIYRDLKGIATRCGKGKWKFSAAI